MPRLKTDDIEPTLDEDAAINRGIAADPDNPELSDEFFKRAKRGRGPQKAPVKERITIRLDADIAEHFRGSGPGWQSRINETLRRAISRTSKARHRR